MIHSGRAGPTGTWIELHRGGHIISARVVWRNGSRAGLQSEERLPVEQIMAASPQCSLQLVASGGALIDRRKKERPSSVDARQIGRCVEFVGLSLLVVTFAVGLGRWAADALGRPLAEVASALGKE